MTKHSKAETEAATSVSVRMATDALTMASRKTSSGYREKHGSGCTCYKVHRWLTSFSLIF
ncbi:MAG: hypothetical protein MRZ75_08785 [Roseburia sp.]|nr:hypothetical protein [Roseburia sp.]